MTTSTNAVTKICGSVFLLAFLGTLLSWPEGIVHAATLHVANNGVDSATCGAVKEPCRSLSQAIANASEGNRLVVGPGRYGDLDGDGAFTLPGEEAAEVGTGCFCMIKVDKRLTIESRAGAGATILDAGGAAVSVVRIQASGVVFGKAKKGFTLTRGFRGLMIDATNIQVGGNLVTGLSGGAGFETFNGTRLSGNLAVGLPGPSGVGFELRDASENVLTGNLAVANQGRGFHSVGNGHMLTGNQSSGNLTGYRFQGDGHRLIGNVASANLGSGFIMGAAHVLTGNGVHGNSVLGIQLSRGPSEVRRNNFAGNGIVGIKGQINCGLLNDTNGALTASNNFWGAATGPGADPADAVCNSGIGSSTTAAPFAAKEFPITARPLF